jgi:SAM-dependent methyltransferase
VASYTSLHTNLSLLFHEARHLYRLHSHHIPETVDSTLTELRSLEQFLREEYSFELRDRDVLDIGVGQFLPQAYYFALHNRVVGIDFDVIAQGANPLHYIRMLRRNGPKRTGKTLIRKMAGIDRRYRSELKSRLHVDALPTCRVLQMDACNMAFRPNEFDFIHSYSTFHHIQDPAHAIEGVKRVLRPGGIIYLSFQLFTSGSGALSPTRLIDSNGQPVLWPHLRREFADRLEITTYVNKIRLAEWRRLFQERMPECRILLTTAAGPDAEANARDLQARGELTDYNIEELLTHRVRIVWQKK